MIEVGTKVKITKKALDKLGSEYGALDKSYKKIFEVQKGGWFDIGKTMRKYYVNGLWFFKKDFEVYTQEEFPEYYI
jgi:hypothetical protein